MEGTFYLVEMQRWHRAAVKHDFTVNCEESWVSNCPRKEPVETAEGNNLIRFKGREQQSKQDPWGLGQRIISKSKNKEFRRDINCFVLVLLQLSGRGRPLDNPEPLRQGIKTVSSTPHNRRKDKKELGQAKAKPNPGRDSVRHNAVLHPVTSDEERVRRTAA